VSLRPLTDGERTAARLKATAARAERADIKAKLKSGQATVAEVIDAGRTVEAIGRLRVAELLESLPGVGKVKARRLMEEVGISETRRVQGLGEKQRKALFEKLSAN
jgi:hypothetical protein